MRPRLIHDRLRVPAALLLAVWLSGACSTEADSSGRDSDADPGGPAAEQVAPKTLDATGKLVGNLGSRSFPPGEGGKLSAVDVGPPDLDYAYLPVLVRNNTNETFLGLDVTAKGLDPSGKAVALGDNRGITLPAEVGPGELAFATLWLDPVPQSGEDVAWDVQVTGQTDDIIYPYATLRMTDASVMEESFIGTATNDTGTALTNPHIGMIACFSKTGELLAVEQGLGGGPNDLPNGAEFDFSGDLSGTTCPKFMVGASAHIP